MIGKIGENLQLTTAYNTEATFDFENQMKLEFTGQEDDIIKKIELGNVALPLNGSLITGSQSLFGIKTQLQFGKLTVTSVYSQQRGRKSTVRVEGGAQVQKFEIKADQYDENRHYFLGHFFRNQYERALASPPLINSAVIINRVEVWVINTNFNTQQTRNVIGFQDLGEDGQNLFRNSANDPNGWGDTRADAVATNDANNLYQSLSSNQALRGFTGAQAALDNLGLAFDVDYRTISQARMLNENEYRVHSQLGYISLNQELNQNQALAVSYQYTFNGQTYQVGDFSTDGINNDEALYLKLLKSTTIRTNVPMWDLMMKNVYNIGAFQVQQDQFR
ncbi:MAG: cell surface protein SprA, partial [Bacteroidota bacterium]